MRVIIACIFGVLSVGYSFAQTGPYPPAADSLGTTAVKYDSNIIYAWVDQVTITRGPQDITNPSGPLADVGHEWMATGPYDGAIISLGDGGYAIAEVSLSDVDGYDFAIFENGFYDLANGGYFLELAFVEVSSDGVNFFRFPTHSLNSTDTQIASFGTMDPTQVDGFAGKYGLQYGVPFDLAELDTVVGLDIYNVSHIKIIDVVGNIDGNYSTYDSYGNAVNDPWPTSFGSGGFDLDAIALIDSSLVTSVEQITTNSVSVYPNPASDVLNITGDDLGPDAKLVLTDINGLIVLTNSNGNRQLEISDLPAGVYFLSIEDNGQKWVEKIMKL